jgi:hypothetical protein
MDSIGSPVETDVDFHLPADILRRFTPLQAPLIDSGVSGL